MSVVFTLLAAGVNPFAPAPARFDVFDATDGIFVISNVERKEADRLARSARKNYPECRIEVRPARPAAERLV